MRKTKVKPESLYQLGALAPFYVRAAVTNGLLRVRGISRYSLATVRAFQPTCPLHDYP